MSRRILGAARTCAEIAAPRDRGQADAPACPPRLDPAARVGEVPWGCREEYDQAYAFLAACLVLLGDASGEAIGPLRPASKCVVVVEADHDPSTDAYPDCDVTGRARPGTGRAACSLSLEE